MKPSAQRSAYRYIEAESADETAGVSLVTPVWKTWYVTDCHNFDYIRHNNVVFDEVGSRTFKAKVSGVARHSKIEIVLDSVGGEVIGTCPVPQTGDGIWQYVSCPIARTTGTHNVILKFYGNSEDNLLHIDKYKFVQDDGVHYGDAVAEGFGQGNTAQTEIRFPQQKGRFIKLDLTDPEDRIWTIYELNVWNIPGEEE